MIRMVGWVVDGNDSGNCPEHLHRQRVLAHYNRASAVIYMYLKAVHRICALKIYDLFAANLKGNVQRRVQRITFHYSRFVRLLCESVRTR